jgi:hypothetical protein
LKPTGRVPECALAETDEPGSLGPAPLDGTTPSVNWLVVPSDPVCYGSVLSGRLGCRREH